MRAITRNPTQLAIHQLRQRQLITKLTKYRCDIRVQQLGFMQTLHQRGYTTRLLEGIHIRGAIRVNLRQQWNHIRQITDVLPGQQNPRGTCHRQHMNGVVRTATRSQQSDNPIEQTFLGDHLIERTILR
ncbi:Uncharacterised protein [Vibrio cholerae]|nr:Uncharacterised protein [Vibrio cholerae]